MIPGHDVTVATRRETARKKTRWHKPQRCSICTSAIWFHPIALKEPVGAPEPRREWVLCRVCHETLLMEMRRSPVHSPLRLRIAMGLVASERSPRAYGTRARSCLRDQRRFVGIAWLLIIFALLHLILFVVLATNIK